MAGSVMYHRPGWRTKRRTWLELSDNLICAYSSSKDADKLQPLCTVLLSSINKILPLDKSHPRIIRILRSTDKTSPHDYLEFDTIESANHWRQELQGALVLYRHSRAQIYDTDSTGARGIRISVPLIRIDAIRTSVNPDLIHIVDITISPAEDDSAMPPCRETGILHIGPIMSTTIWDSLQGIILGAKLKAKSQLASTDFPIFVDFGALPFFKDTTSPDAVTSTQKDIIGQALGFEPDEGMWVVPARLYGALATGGYLVISEHYVGIWTQNLAKRDIKYRIAGRYVFSIKPRRFRWLSLDAVSISLRDKKELKLVFKTSEDRDEAVKRVESLIAASTHSPPPVLHSNGSIGDSFSASISTDSAGSLASTTTNHNVRSQSSIDTAAGILAPLSRTTDAVAAAAGEMSYELKTRLPKAINLPRTALLFPKRLHFVCLTIGSRGDVQPYIALGVGLLREGHQVTIATHNEYREWILVYGIGHRPAGGDPGELMKLSVENKIMSPEFFKKSMKKFRPWLNDLLVDAWVACQDADVLVESPSAMAGVHIAEALKIPYFRAFSMPWTKTVDFPHPFLSPPVDSPTFNSASYILFSNVMWLATAGQINKWRRSTLHLENTDMGRLSQSKIVFIYFFSENVVPKPLDWPDTVSISGYWFLRDSDPDWKLPSELSEWMARARRDQKPIVYIGFGSITVPNPHKTFARLLRGVLKSGARAILSRGWADRMDIETIRRRTSTRSGLTIPPECFLLDRVPHEWLFPLIDAALHHGGAGTTAASLRAGIPTLIKPWFGDQFFWASRVEELGVGLKVPNLKSTTLSKALIRATIDIDMKKKAMSIGAKLQAEDGVHNAIYTIYTYLYRASQDRKSLKLGTSC